MDRKQEAIYILDSLIAKAYPAMYLHRNKGDLTIELPAIQFTESKTDSTKS